MLKKRHPPKPMTACERGVWIDTEGTIRTQPRKGAYWVGVFQTERKPLEDYCAGAIRDGIPCRVKYKAHPTAPRYPYYYALISGAENVAKEIKLTQPYIRTAAKHIQIQHFKNAIATPRLKLDIRIKKARKILNI